jgi:PRTRC genetic system protein B
MPSATRNKPALLAPVDENAVQRLSNFELSTTHALLFHCGRNRQLQIVTTHRVTTRKGRAPAINAGRPITPSDEREIYELLTSRPASAGRGLVFPPRLLYRDAGRIAWWVPGAVRPMHLRNPEGQRTIVTTWPTLVFLVEERKLYLTALSTPEHPSAETELFHAPLPNVHDTTSVCTGDALLPLSCDIPDIAGWEAVIFDTAFTHPNWQGGIVNTAAEKDTTVQTYWQRRDQDLTPFPTPRLSNTGMTLGEWLRSPAGAAR